jgi:hypothetical protein
VPFACWNASGPKFLKLLLAGKSYLRPMLAVLLFWLPLSALSLLSVLVMGGPRLYDWMSLALALLVFWGWLGQGWPAAAVWLLLAVGLRLALHLDYSARRRGTDAGAGGSARYLSFLPVDGATRRPLVLHLPLLRAPLFWLAARLRQPLPQAGNRPAAEVVLPVLRQLFGASRGFRLDTRHLPGAGSGAMEIRCD